MKNSKTSIVCAIALLAATQAKAQMVVSDPMNLIENSIAAIQTKFSSGSLRDNGRVANSQLKADNQTVAEAIGIDDAVNTDLNLEMARNKYTIEPSPYFKNYIVKFGFSAQLNKTKNTYNNAVAYFGTSSGSKGAAAAESESVYLQTVAKRITAISDINNLTFNGNSSGVTTEGTNTSSYENSGGGSGDDQSAYNTAEKAYETSVKNASQEIDRISKMKEEIMSGNTGVVQGYIDKFLNITSFGLFGKSKDEQIKLITNALDQDISAQKGILDKAGETFKSTVGGGFGGVFGGSATQKGKGQKVTITAANGVLNDRERVEVANDLFKELEELNASLQSYIRGSVVTYTQYDNKIKMLQYQTKTYELYKGLESKNIDKSLQATENYDLK